MIAIGGDTYDHGSYIIVDVIIKIFVLLRGILFVPYQIRTESNPRRPYLSSTNVTSEDNSKPLMSGMGSGDGNEPTIDTYQIMQHFKVSTDNSSRRTWNAWY